MPDLTPEIRNTTRALIFQRNQVLLLRKLGSGRPERFALPGGAQNPGESLTDALNRECIEEIGTAVNNAELVYVADFIKLRNTQPPTRRHVVDFLFSCKVPDDYSPHNGEKPDKSQVEVLFVSLSKLAHLPLFPHYLSSCITNFHPVNRSPYLGKFDDQPDT